MVDLVIDESKVWSPEERQAYADALPEMSLFEDHIIEGDVMAEAMQALIEEGETAQTLALHWKTKGNELFSVAKKTNRAYFKDALKYYSDAFSYALTALTSPPEDLIELDCDPVTMASTILSNRAAVHLELRNYRSCRSDAARALSYWDQNIKACYRGAKASYMLQNPEDTIAYTKVGLKIDPENKNLLDLRTKADALLVKVIAERKEAKVIRESLRRKTMAYKAICDSRGIKVGPTVVTDNRVLAYAGKATVNPESQLMDWAAMFLYDEYNTSDFIQSVSEGDMLIEHLAQMFPETGPFAPWDENRTYVASKLAIYAAANVVFPFETEEEWHVALSSEAESDVAFEKRERREELLDCKNRFWIKVSPFCTLGQLLKHPQYVVAGIPMINIVVKDSEHEKKFLTQIKHRVIPLSEK